MISRQLPLDGLFWDPPSESSFFQSLPANMFLYVVVLMKPLFHDLPSVFTFLKDANFVVGILHIINFHSYSLVNLSVFVVFCV